MADFYSYLGGQDFYYQDYLDNATGRMLTVTAGGTYSMTATMAGKPVPPGDGRWSPVTPPAPVLTPAPAPAPEPEPAPDGGES